MSTGRQSGTELKSKEEEKSNVRQQGCEMQRSETKAAGELTSMQSSPCLCKSSIPVSGATGIASFEDGRSLV